MLTEIIGINLFDKIYENDPNEKIYFCSGRRNANAQGVAREDGFYVKEGSICSEDFTPSTPNSLKSMREQLLADGVLKKEKEGYRFTKEHKFGAASTAAAIVLGRSVPGGGKNWKSKDGTKYGE